MNACFMPSADFFTVSEYKYKNTSVCDFSDCPRPHFCIGFLLEGEADFFPVGETEPIHVSVGDLIFVPITSRYVSRWRGNPAIRYISYHFSFTPGSGISEKNHFLLQKLHCENFEMLKHDFRYAAEHYTGDTQERMAVFGAFCTFLSSILPRLRHRPEQKCDERIGKAIEYIRLHAEEPLSVPKLAMLCSISTSHFYTRFREEVGMTPIDYKHSVLIGRATQLLLSGEENSIEAISDALGFASATYFRRVFKKITGKSPSEYKKTAAEL